MQFFDWQGFIGFGSPLIEVAKESQDAACSPNGFVVSLDRLDLVDGVVA